MTEDWLKQAQAVIMEVLTAARPELLAAHGNIDDERKADNSPVTLLDKKIERQLDDALANFDSGVSILGEELGGDTESETFWLIDPIDGTESFIRGLPFVRNIVTLVEGNQPVFTLVYKPISDELYTAVRGGGAFKNGQPIHVSNRPLSRTWLDLTFSDHAAELLAALKTKVKVKRIGEYTYAAEGKIDAFLNGKGGGLWDNAPRGLLLAESGARVANIGSDTYDYRNSNFLAANPLVFDELMQLITDAIPPTDTVS